jgi:hypothetical protein
MIEGLLWFPLLGIFILLAWAGWNEFQKLTMCQTWAKDFKRYKYDVACVLGQNYHSLIWGKPTRQGPVDLQALDLRQVCQIQLFSGDQVFAPSQCPSQGSPPFGIEFQVRNPTTTASDAPDHSPHQTLRIPFTELEMAKAWAETLSAEWLNSGTQD